ncbi:MAG: nucleotidyltransferase, partial [Ekhidna sp.]|nr:nucleotidyltransferase [Ekhidna sp.]
VIVNADDLYGFAGLKLVYDYIKLKKPTDRGICLAGYSLKRTLSENGGVSRGLCDMDEKLKLRSVKEAIEIKRKTDGRITGRIQDEKNLLLFSGDETVSMNLIGMTPALLEDLKTDFETFVLEHQQDLDAEFYIPDFINNQIESVDVQVLKTDSKWFGVTYPADKPLLQSNIQKLIKDGVYPEELWQ